MIRALIGRSALAGGLVLTICAGAIGGSASAAEAPIFIPWSAILPGFSSAYVADSSNVCTSGSVSCVDAVIAEMQRRFEPLAAACSHNAVFSLTYLRTTEEYRRSVDDPTFFTDTPFINHQDALFAKYYFDAWDAWQARDLAAVPKAWKIAFDAADRKRVSGAGNLFLGMSAHVNRDLPYVLAEIGLVKPDGTSRKVDHDKVNEFLNRVIEPLMTEASRRFDPTISLTNIQGTTLDETVALQLLVAWREAAWRNAERLVAATTPAARAAAEQSIETFAAIQAELLVAATAYFPVDATAATALASTLNLQVNVMGALDLQVLVNTALTSRLQNVLKGVLPLFGSGAGTRDRYCTTHWNS